MGTIAVVLATRYADPSLLFQVTHEDGIVEWGTVMALVALLVFLLLKLPKLPSDRPRLVKWCGYTLALLSFLAAGEEVSWGQRLFGIKTSETFERLNYQHENNLHNLIPAELFNGLIIISVGLAFVLLPMLWRRFRDPGAWWLPSEQLSFLTLSVILVNHYRVSSTGEKAGLVLLVVILALATATSLRRKEWKLAGICGLGWLTSGTLYHCRFVLPAANGQYEIRELLVILVVTAYCSEIFRFFEKTPDS